MLSKETQRKMLALLSYSAEEIAELVDTEEEKDAELPEGLKVFNAEEYTTLEKNLKESGKTGYIKAGKEIAVKELKEKLELDYEGKDTDTLIARMTDKIQADALIEPGRERAQWELERQQLQDSLAAEKNKVATLEQEKTAHARDAEWLRKLPAKRNNLVSDEDRLLLLKAKLKEVTEDDATVYEYKGKRLLDDKAAHLGLEQALEYVFTEERWLTEPEEPRQGRGAGSSNGSTIKPMKLSEVTQQWEAQGRTALGADFQTHVLSLKKENPAFDLNG